MHRRPRHQPAAAASVQGNLGCRELYSHSASRNLHPASTSPSLNSALEQGSRTVLSLISIGTLSQAFRGWERSGILPNTIYLRGISAHTTVTGEFGSRDSMALFRKRFAGRVSAAAAPSPRSGAASRGHHRAHFHFAPKTECRHRATPPPRRRRRRRGCRFGSGGDDTSSLSVLLRL